MAPGEAEATLSVQDLNKLPSYKDFYKKFNEGCSGCVRGSMGTIEGTLEQCHNIGELKDKIINACCCMYQIEDSGSTQYMKKCNFLYYWITDILIKEVDSSSFTSTLRTVIGALEKFLSEHECQILNPKNINKKSIKEEKIVYDFWHNRNPIQTLIKGSGSDCDKKYGNYLKEIESAYSEIYKICEKDTSGPYCIEFNSKCKQYGPTGQLDLKCPSAQQEGNLAHQGGLGSHSGKVPPEQDTITAEHSQSTDDTAPPEGSAVPTAAVSGGALVAIGLATMAFLLYKVYNYHL
ncbi:Variable surface protein Vir7-like protein [Plasmodium coatneyi]|uniref:Variable surface protein Vir7-like protein n=1 Tax=Plasmodium coatneyi TaxID=208452 RepID=A0A1B1E530_9APIC|nr:Variable surface protein Vir7-like protein [Plasmodium coatneyi]ANQ10134.1 Variable surface protein Vir7-like protein [Plasmodium coatneyi]